ncbi:MAG: DUF975 family protein [Phycisphaerae bacterium]
MSQWYAYAAGAQYGPVPWETLRSWAADGRVGRGDFVWTAGMDDWARVSSVAGLFAAPPRSEGVPPGVVQIPGTGGTGGQTPNGDITAAARRRLRGNWGLPIAFCLLLGLIQGTANYLPYVGWVAALILSGPFTLGGVVFFLTFARGGYGELGMLFSGFRRFSRALATYLWMYLLVLLWMLGGAVGGAVVGAIPGALLTVAAGNAEMLVISVLAGAALGSLVAVTVAALAYSQTFYLLADRPELGAVDVVSTSRDIMKGRKLKLLCLELRFFGWGILCIFTLGIGFLWLVPYMSTAFAYFYEDLQPRRGDGSAGRAEPQIEDTQQTPPETNPPQTREAPPDHYGTSLAHSHTWYYIGPDGVGGPVQRGALRRLVRDARISPDVLVWQPGRCIWNCASTVDGLLDSRTRRRPELTLPRPAEAGTGGTTPNSEIVIRSMELLQGARFKSAMFSALVVMVMLSALVLLRAGTLLAFLLAGQFLFAAALFFLTVVRGGQARVAMASAGFRRPMRSLAAYLATWLVVLPQAVGGWLLGMLLGVIVGAAWWLAFDSPEVVGSGWLWGGGVGATLSAVVGWLSYSQVPFVIVDHPDRSIFGALRDSAEMMQGHQGRYFRLCLRFVGYMVAIVFSFGAGVFWLVPIMGASAAAFYEDLQPPRGQSAAAEDPEPAPERAVAFPAASAIAAPKSPESSSHSRPNASTVLGP